MRDKNCGSPRLMKRVILLFAALPLLASTTRSAVTFDLNFPDVTSHTSQNWDDPAYGAAARAKLQEVLNEFGRNFADTAAIQLVITSSMTTQYAAGAYSTPDQLQPGLGFYDSNAYSKIRRGVDLNGATVDGGIEYSFNFAGLHYADKNSDGLVDMRDFILNLPGLTRHEVLHVVGHVSGIDATTRSNSRPTRHDTFLYDSAGRPFFTSGSVSAVANLDDAASYFDPIGSGPNYQIARQYDFSHLIGTTFPFRELVNNDDRAYLATLGYPLAPPVGKLLNISTRLRVQTGDNVLIAGFIVTGADPKRLVIRAIGPSFTEIPGRLADPNLEVSDERGVYVPLQHNWRDNQQEELQATGLAPTNDFEAATVRTFPPGSYTAIVRGEGNTSGIGSVEVYDLSADSDSRVANISTRGFVENGDNVMIGGFIIGEDPSQDCDLIIRALGPSLAAGGVPNPLSDPVLRVVDAHGAIVRENDDWRETQEAALTASGFAPANNAESAMLISRPSGPTTAIVSGKNGATGNALVEVYRLR
jgi:hypothetical protein